MSHQNVNHEDMQFSFSLGLPFSFAAALFELLEEAGRFALAIFFSNLLVDFPNELIGHYDRKRSTF